jgi:hypothetical protein
VEPHSCRRQSDEDDTKNFDHVKTMFVVVMIVVVVIVPFGMGRCRLRKMKTCLSHFASIGASFVPVQNSHTASELLVEISLDDRNQLVGSLKLRRLALKLRRENMKTNVPLDQLSHQAVESAPAGGHELQNLLALPIPLKSAFDGLGLSLDPADARQQLLLVLSCMRHYAPPVSNIVL